MNAGDYEILKETYSKGEDYMENYNLLDKVKRARKKMNQSIEEAYQTLKPFNVTKSEILRL
jgi:vacuolar-type H+-ATPase subunit D/Vma8